jgi:hypothetical protein
VNMWGNNTPQVEAPQPIEEAGIPIVETTEEAGIEIPVEQAKVEPATQERVVEKIVEKQLEFIDDYSKSLYESLSTGTDEEAYKYLQEKYKDYNNMADVDVIKMKLQRDNPSWNQKDLDAEIKFKYGKNLEYKDLESIDRDEEPEKYAAAEQYNDDVERKLNSIERDARDSRNFLNEQKKNIELPKIAKAENVAQAAQPTAEEIEAHNKAWELSVETELPKLSDLSFKVGDEEVSYKATNEEKAALMAKMKNFSDVDYLTSRGWYDEKGNMNILKVAEDVRKLENIDKIISSVSTQLKTSVTKDVKASIKNIDLKPQSQSTEVFADRDLWN